MTRAIRVEFFIRILFRIEKKNEKNLVLIQTNEMESKYIPPTLRSLERYFTYERTELNFVI